MRDAKTRLLLGWVQLGTLFALAWGAAIFICPTPSSALASGADPIGNFERRFTYFYKNPDLDEIPETIRIINKSVFLGEKSNAKAPISGFLAALFQQNPNRVDSWISGEYTRDVQGVIGLALAWAGMADKSAIYLRKQGWPEAAIGKIARVPTNLLMMRIRNANDLDILWGAAFATGDRRFPERIIDFVANSVERKEFGVEEMAFFGIPFTPARKSEPEFKKIMKHKEKAVSRLAIIGSALWALGSNAVQHEFVGEVVRDRIAALPDSDLSYLLRKSMFRATSSKGAAIRGKRFTGVLSQSVTRVLAKHENARIGSNALQAIFKELDTVFKNEFQMSEPVHISGVLVVPPGETVGALFEIADPNGLKFNLGPFEMRGTGNKDKLMAISVPIEPSQCSVEGVYTIRAEFRAQENDVVVVENQFFVGNR